MSTIDFETVHEFTFKILKVGSDEWQHVRVLYRGELPTNSPMALIGLWDIGYFDPPWKEK